MVKHLIVVQAIAGSSPVLHPTMPLWWNGRHNEFKPRKLQVRLLSGIQIASIVQWIELLTTNQKMEVRVLLEVQTAPLAQQDRATVF